MSASAATFDDSLAPPETTNDRLPPMLFLAALFHALVILGVTFDPGLEFADSAATTLDVTILADADQNVERNDDAELLAQANQIGAGTSDDAIRPSSGADGLPVPDELTELLGDIPPDFVLEQAPDTPVVAVVADEARLALETRATEEAIEQPPQALPSGLSDPLPAPIDATDRSEIPADDVRELVFSVDTRESDLAYYLNNWKRKVEAAGTAYLQEQMDRRILGSPVIEVAVDADGRLTEIIVKRSSGSGVIDQAALDVLRRAAPYDPIPAPLARQYDRLRFEYKFEFREDGG